jgi:hypothetical protein
LFPLYFLRRAAFGAVLLPFAHTLYAHEIQFEKAPIDDEAKISFESLVFSYNPLNNPPIVEVKFATPDRSWSIFTDPEIFSISVLMSSPNSLCNYSLRKGCSSNPTSTKAQETVIKADSTFAMTKIYVTLAALAESMQSLPESSKKEYVLTEKPWNLTYDAFDPNIDHFEIKLFSDQVEKSDSTLTGQWRASLHEDQLAIVKRFNTLIIMKRLIYSGFNRMISSGFPAGAYLSMLGEVRPHYADYMLEIEHRRAVEQWLKNLDPDRTAPCEGIRLIVKGFGI